MTAVSKHVCNDKLDEKINKYNNKYHRIIKKEQVDVKVDTYIDYGFEYNKKDLEFKVGDQIEEDHYTKKYFAKGYTPNWFGEVFTIKKAKKYCIIDLRYQRS